MMAGKQSAPVVALDLRSCRDVGALPRCQVAQHRFAPGTRVGTVLGGEPDQKFTDRKLLPRAYGLVHEAEDACPRRLSEVWQRQLC